MRFLNCCTTWVPAADFQLEDHSELFAALSAQFCLLSRGSPLFQEDFLFTILMPSCSFYSKLIFSTSGLVPGYVSSPCFSSKYISLPNLLKKLKAKNKRNQAYPTIHRTLPTFSALSMYYICFYFLKEFIIYLLFNRGEEREKEGERNINVWLPLTHPLLGMWLTTQACDLTGNRTSDLLVHRPALNPLSHTSQGVIYFYWAKTY